jgi:hypothetical protein
MHIIGCDLHTRQQTLAILDTATGGLEQRVLEDDGNNVEEFYSNVEGPVCIELGSGCGSCCATTSITKSSAVVDGGSTAMLRFLWSSPTSL